MARADLSRYIDLPYALEVRLEIDDDGNWFYTALHHELLGCRGQGTSPEEAIASLREARGLYLTALIEADVEVPMPIVFKPTGRNTPSFSIEDVPVKADKENQVEVSPARVAVHSGPEARATARNVASGEGAFWESVERCAA